MQTQTNEKEKQNWQLVLGMKDWVTNNHVWATGEWLRSELFSYWVNDSIAFRTQWQSSSWSRLSSPEIIIGKRWSHVET